MTVWTTNRTACNLRLQVPLAFRARVGWRRSIDALPEVLGAVRLTGAVSADTELRAHWSYVIAPAREIADVLMPDADHVIPYHLVTEGTCYSRLPRRRSGRASCRRPDSLCGGGSACARDGE